MGPNFDFKVRRRQEADADVLKQALRRPKVAKKDVEKGLGKKRKNIETDDMGDKVGRIHLGKQEFGKLQYVRLSSLSLPHSRSPFPSRLPLPRLFHRVSKHSLTHLFSRVLSLTGSGR